MTQWATMRTLWPISDDTIDFGPSPTTVSSSARRSIQVLAPISVAADQNASQLRHFPEAFCAWDEAESHPGRYETPHDTTCADQAAGRGHVWSDSDARAPISMPGPTTVSDADIRPLADHGPAAHYGGRASSASSAILGAEMLGARSSVIEKLGRIGERRASVATINCRGPWPDAPPHPLSKDSPRSDDPPRPKPCGSAR